MTYSERARFSTKKNGKGPVKVHKRWIFLQFHIFRGVEQECEICFCRSASENRYFPDFLA